MKTATFLSTLHIKDKNENCNLPKFLYTLHIKKE